MTHSYSAAVKLADLDDFLSPAQSCILPLLDDRKRSENVADRPHDSAAGALLPSADAAADASLRATISNPSRHDRTRKIERHAEKRRLVPPSSARGISSSAADRDGFGLSGRAAAVSGTPPEQVQSSRSSSSSSKSPSAPAGSSKGSAAASKGYSFPASAEQRPSLIKLGPSRFSKRQDIDVPFRQVPAAASGSSSSSTSPVASSSSSSVAPSSSGTAPALPGSSPRRAAAAAAAAQGEKQVARVALYDCLACKGCVTSSEAVLVERHSVDEFLRRTGVAGRRSFAAADREGSSAAEGPRPAAEAPPGVADAAAATAEAKAEAEAAAAASREGGGEGAAAAASALAPAAGPAESGEAAPRLVVVSVSPQSLAALAQHFRMQSAAATLRKLSSLFRLAGATHVLHTAVGDAISVLEVEREFIARCRKAGIGSGGDAAAAARPEGETVAASGAWDAAAAAAGCTLPGGSAEYPGGSRGAAQLAAVAPEAAEKAAAHGDAAPAAAAAAGKRRRGRATPRLVGEQRRGGELTAAASREECSNSVKSSSSSSSGRSGSRTFEYAGPAVDRPNSPFFGMSDAQQQQDVQQQKQQQEQNKQRMEEKRQQQEEEEEDQQGRETRASARRPADASSCDLPMLASFCPGFVCYAETSYDAPLLLQHMSRVRSGQQIQGLLVKGLLLELHNAAAFLLRYAAAAPALPGAGISPLLLQLLLRRSAYASPSCWRTVQPLEAAAGGGRDAAERLPLFAAAAVPQRAAAASPSALWQPRAAPAAAAAEALHKEEKEKEEEQQGETQQLLEQPAATRQTCWRRPAPAGVNDSAILGRSVAGLSYDGKCLSAAEEIRAEDVFHVCIMPCFDKKLEAARPEFRRPVGRSAAAAAASAVAAAPPRGGGRTAAVSPSDAAAAAVSTVGAAEAAAAAGAGEGGEASRVAAAAAGPSGREASAAAAAASTERSRSSTAGSGSGGTSDEEVTAADVDLVLATNEVLVLLQRMQVQFQDLPESHVNTFLDDFFPLRSRVSAAAVPAPAAPREATGAAVAAAPGTATALAQDQDSAIHKNSLSSSSRSDAAASLSLGLAPPPYLSAAGSPAISSCFAMALPLLHALRSLALSPCRLLHAAAMSPYISSSRWCWWSSSSRGRADALTGSGCCKERNRRNADGSRESSSSSGDRQSGAASAGSSSSTTTTTRRSCVSPRGGSGSSSCSKREPPSTPASLGRQQDFFLCRAMAAIVQHDERSCLRKADNGDACFVAAGGPAGESCCSGAAASAAASGCFISAEEVCGSGGYAERLFRRAAEELFGVRVEGPVAFQKRKGGNEGLREAVLVVDGEEKLRVALAYGFNNIQKVIQKMKRQRQLAPQPARATHSAAAVVSPASSAAAAAAVVSPASSAAAAAAAVVSPASSAAAAAVGATPRTAANAQAAGAAAGAAAEAHQQQREPGGGSQTEPQQHGQAPPSQQQHRQESPGYRGQQQERQQPQQQGKRAVRPLPHFVEVAACPGGCLGGGGQKLEDSKKNTSGSSSVAATASHVSAAGPSPLSETLEKKERKNEEQLQERQQQQQPGQDSKNHPVSEPSSSHKLSAQRNETTAPSEKRLDRSASGGNAAAAAASSAARTTHAADATEEARAGHGSRQAQSLAALTTFLHRSHIYCDPLQRLEVQLAYLYLLDCAEPAKRERQGQSVAGEEADGLQRRQQEEPQQQLQPLQQPQHKHRSQPEALAEQRTQTPGLLAQAQTQPQPQQKDQREQQQLHQQQEEDQQRRREQQQDQLQQPHDPRRAGREGYPSDGCGETRKEAASQGEEIRPSRLCLSAADERPTGRKAGSAEEGVYDYSVLPCGEEALGSISNPSTRTGTSDGAAAETVAGTLEWTTKAADAAFAETAAAQTAETPEAAADVGWWDAFGENKAAVKLLRTRFREIWRGNTGTVPPQENSAGTTEQSSTARTGYYRAVGAKPSLHW